MSTTKINSTENAINCLNKLTLSDLVTFNPDTYKVLRIVVKELEKVEGDFIEFTASGNTLINAINSLSKLSLGELIIYGHHKNDTQASRILSSNILYVLEHLIQADAVKGK